MERRKKALGMVMIAVVAAQTSLRATVTIVTNTSPGVREIGANYFDSLSQSQVWVNIEPESTEQGPAPLILNVTVAFPGRSLNREPPAVTLRAQTRCSPMALPARVRRPILRFALNGTTTLDLTTPGAVYLFIASCSRNSPSDTIVTDVPFGVLRQIVGETDVVVEALGFSARLTASDLAALRTFVQTVASGVVVQ
jgi:hypothetical protein